MAYDLQTGSTGLRAEVIDSMVKQIASRSYKFKQALSIVPTNAWKNTFFREQVTIPAGQTGNATSNIPRGAAFPQYSIGWDEISVRISKFGLEENIAWEDVLSNDINIQARTVIRLTEGVTKAVDDVIWDGLTENRVPVNVQTFNVETTIKGPWDEASGSIIWDLMNASRLIAEANYGTEDLLCFISPKDKISIMKFITDKGAQYPQFSQNVAQNGEIGVLAGIKLIESNSVTASWALVCKPKTCGTWKELVSLRSVVTEDPLKSVRVRVCEEGVLEVTDPKAIVAISGTQSV
jgi:hypothetical protein